MISVVMATYNGEKYISKQLDSILAQTVLPSEVIVSDDASTDNTIDIIEQYKKKCSNIKWTVLRNKDNQGYVKNYLKGFSAVNGDIIILCDQDDEWKPDKIERTLYYFSDDSVLSVHNDIDIVDMEGNVIKSGALGYKEKKEKMPVERFVRHLYYCGMSSAFRKSLLPLILSQNPGLLPTHDWLVHAAAVCCDGFYTSSEVLSLRKSHGDNLALNLDKTERKGIEQRIGVVRYYVRHYSILKDLYNKYSMDCKKQEFVEKVLSTNEERVKYLEEHSLLNAVKCVRKIEYYPTRKAYVSDLLYLLRVF